MKLTTTLSHKDARRKSRVSIQITTQAEGRFASHETKQRHKNIVDGCHRHLAADFHVQDIRIR